MGVPLGAMGASRPRRTADDNSHAAPSGPSPKAERTATQVFIPWPATAVSPYDTPPRVKKEEAQVIPFPTMCTPSRKCKPTRPNLRIQPSDIENPDMPAPAQPHPERYLPTHNASPATLPTPISSGSAPSSYAASMASERVLKREPTELNTTALSTPPRSDRKKPLSKSNVRRGVAKEDEDEDDGGAGFYPTPTKVSHVHPSLDKTTAKDLSMFRLLQAGVVA